MSLHEECFRRNLVKHKVSVLLFSEADLERDAQPDACLANCRATNLPLREVSLSSCWHCSLRADLAPPRHCADAFILAFVSPVTALNFCMDVQADLLTLGWPQPVSAGG